MNGRRLGCGYPTPRSARNSEGTANDAARKRFAAEPSAQPSRGRGHEERGIYSLQQTILAYLDDLDGN